MAPIMVSNFAMMGAIFLIVLMAPIIMRGDNHGKDNQDDKGNRQDISRWV